MRRILGLILITVFISPNGACAPRQDQAVKKAFPECFAEPMIGAGSGAKCEYREDKKEWRITFWKGWGDCPAGCIHKEDTAWYVVDEKGRVFKTDAQFNPLQEIKPDEPIEQGSIKSGIMVEPPAKDFIEEPTAGPGSQGAGSSSPHGRTSG